MGRQIDKIIRSVKTATKCRTSSLDKAGKV